MKNRLFILIVVSLFLASCQSEDEKRKSEKRLQEKMEFYKTVSATFSPFDEDSLINIYDSMVSIDDDLGKQFANETSKKITQISDSIYKVNQALLIKSKKEEMAADEKFKKSKAGKIKAKHPEWTKEECENIAGNKIWIGMSYKMLVFMWGKPNTINTSNYGRGNEYQACWDDYNPSCFYFGEDEIIRSYN